TLTPTVLAAQHTLAPPFPHLAETLAKLPIAKVKDRIVFIPPYDYHTALDEYNARWETVLPHQTTRPLPSVGLDLFGLQSHAFIDAEGANPSVLSWPRATLLKANAFRFYALVLVALVLVALVLVVLAFVLLILLLTMTHLYILPISLISLRHSVLVNDCQLTQLVAHWQHPMVMSSTVLTNAFHPLSCAGSVDGGCWRLRFPF
ncbi:hypothetical protein B0A55_02299, partial [Friedmanniomyces simplex]